MSSSMYLERDHAVVGGHLFSPLPRKRPLGDSLMQESHILPCDRDAPTESPLIRKVKDAETTLNSSYIETDSVTSSCMLTSESFYGQPDSSLPCRSDNEFYSIGSAKKAKDEATSHVRPETTSVNDSPSPKPRKRNVNWGDRSSIALSIEYPKSMAAEFTPKDDEKTKNSTYFKICFGTEFSDEDEEDEDPEIDPQPTENDAASDVRTISTANVKARKPLIKVSFLSAATSDLLGVIETEDGMLSPQSLAKFSLPQIQLIIEDLLGQISELNIELMRELPQRDDLVIEKEEKQAYLDRAAARKTRFNCYPSPNRSYTSPFRPNNLIFADAFNPNPEYRYPFNSPIPRLSLDSRAGNCQTIAPKAEAMTLTPTTVGSRLKTYINKFFNPRRSYQPSQLSFIDTDNLESKSF
ncbi:hypothetical protein Aperf_G00000013417 [Anoplocephala perfoliata]